MSRPDTLESALLQSKSEQNKPSYAKPGFLAVEAGETRTNRVVGIAKGVRLSTHTVEVVLLNPIGRNRRVTLSLRSGGFSTSSQ
jgi:hypothetical protein